MRSLQRSALVVLVLGISACSGSSGFKTVEPGSTQRGIASWYGPGFHGKLTANGEVYDMDQVSAAHKTLPFETVVRVQNLDNGQHLDVRINDRGPFVRGRIIDLSREAARRIGMIGSGTARVELEILTVPGSAAKHQRYAVQIGAYRDLPDAEDALLASRNRYPQTRIYSADGWHRVLAGSFKDEKKAAKLARKVERNGISAFVRQVPKGA